MGMKPSESIEDIIDPVKTIVKGCRNETRTCCSCCEEDRGIQEQIQEDWKGISSSKKGYQICLLKEVEVLGQVHVCRSCGKRGHKVADCPDFGKAKSDDKLKANEATAVNTASVEPLLARRLPVVDWEIDTRDAGDEKETISCLLDTGSEITLARSEMKNFADYVCMTDVTFSGLGSRGDAKEIGTLRKKVGKPLSAFCGDDL